MYKRMALLGAMTVAGTAASAADREVAIGVGTAALHGSLGMPATPSRGAAVLLISGSGPTDRDGNSSFAGIRPGTMRLIAEGLAARGIVSLRFDKRGIGASAGAMTREEDLRFTTYVDDVVAWARFLGRQPGVRCVVLAGHSEGSLIAIMAARKTRICGLVSLSGAGRKASEVLAEQMRAAPEPQRAQALHAIDELAHGRTVDLPQFGTMFRASVQPYLISWLPIDPAAELAKVAAPVLIVQGRNDIQVPAGDAERLKRAAPRATLLVLDGTSHILKPAPAERSANIATYADPATPLDPRIVPAIADLVEHARP